MTDDAPVQPDVDVEETPEDVVGNVPSAAESLRYFGADFDVEGIVRRLGNDNFKIPSFNPPPEENAGYAGFQRGYIWSKSQKDRFIESLLLGYPVPGIFLVERPNREYLVLDGQQRLKTLQDFIGGTDRVTERTFRLRYVSDNAWYHGKSFAELSDADQNLLNNTFIQATVVIPRRPNHMQGVYQLFERINSGGTNLQPQEIRVALYAGSRVDALRALNEDPNWRAIFGPVHSRLKDTELILRYLALRNVAVATADAQWDREAVRASVDAEPRPTPAQIQLVYRAPLNQFLNGYLESLGEGGSPEEDAVASFHNAAKALAPFGRAALRIDDGQQVNAAHADAVLVGLSLSKPIEQGETEELSDGISVRLNSLRNNDDYMRAIRESTSHASSIYTRLEIATKTFGDI